MYDVYMQNKKAEEEEGEEGIRTCRQIQCICNQVHM